MLARILAFAVAVLALVSVSTQYVALLDPVATQPVLDKLWFMAGFFTILTNLAVAAHMLAVTRGWQIGASRAAGLLVAIVVVFLIYHAVLARLWQPQGLAWWANQGLHTAVPLATFGWWLAFAPKDVTLRDLPEWLIYPAAYSLYALIRGFSTGFWPYPFLDVGQLGLAQVSLNIAGLIVVYILVGLPVAFATPISTALRRLSR